MDPLGTFKRSLFLGAAIAVFIIVLPLLLLYVSGYRLSYEKKAIVETGGIYIHTEGIDGEISVSSQNLEKPLEKISGLIQGLDPNTYTVNLRKEGFSSWQKNVEVFASKVNDVHPFQIPLSPTIEDIPEMIKNSSGKNIVNTLFKTTKKLFTEENKVRETSNVTLARIDNHLIAIWKGNPSNPPHFFCNTPNICSNAIVVSNNITEDSVWDFFPKRDDVVIFTTKDGIYVSEIDPFGGKNEHAIIIGEYISFRLKGDILYIQNEEKLSSIDLLP